MRTLRGLSGIPFVRSPDTTSDPFAELGKSVSVDDPRKMLEGWTGWALRGRATQPSATDTDVRFEATVGRYQTSPAALLQILAERSRAVAILSVEGQNYEGKSGQWSGTGFIVGRNLLLTNHHVLNSVEVAREARVEFDYQISGEDLLNGDGRTLLPTQAFKLNPERLFITSPTEKGLDYTFVWIEASASDTFGIVPLERSSFTVSKGDFAFIIHHPDGQHKQVSLDDTDVVGIEATVLHYASDTLEGSSGAPVFDRRGRLVALHHASRAWNKELPEGGTSERINEGIKISAIAMDLETRGRRGGADAGYAEAVLKEVLGSDTLAGFFGGHGRRIDTEKPAPEAVVDTYRGTNQDLDIGFWNIEWLANRWQQPGKLNGAARVITDLNLDAWGLSEISPPAIEALVARIRETYGEEYGFALSEPDSASSKQSTAMIWKTSSLRGERVEWPSEVEPLFRQRSDDPDLRIEAVHGKIFDRYPGLFRFTTVGDLPPYTFFTVPLHLKAMDEGSLRRRLASRILARAVEDLVAQDALDVILGGDINAPLAGGDFTAITEAGFAILGAQDESEGAFSYIKSPKSAIDNIFLSPNMRQTVGKVDYFIVARDRTMPDYLGISDHRPVAVRLSLAATNRKVGFDNNDLDKVIRRLLTNGSKAERSKPKKASSRKLSSEPASVARNSLAKTSSKSSGSSATKKSAGRQRKSQERSTAKRAASKEA
ncbi:trypsin-like peptidase domain-containing protein [Methylorubrum podarium]|jgi:Trypsin-like peptidase domain|uniref:trypsin-like peptidase domain-containing protein n=1 Tax=Methylorubrum podarium TaxID=200476 RepID=UPI001EE30095|nr:trypsin-like peptidase domain-containing protein [Methylorubrum podarium]GJE72211.1 hypothetical protein CHKEEEPN_3765 [Methylorubrum podarium]